MAAMQPKPAWKTYLMVTLAMLPTLLTWLFWCTVITPKIDHWWSKIAVGTTVEEMAGLVLLMAYWSNRVCPQVPLIFSVVIVALVILEIAVKNWWARWRLTVLTSLAILANALILFTFCMTSVLTLVLVDISQNGIKSVEKRVSLGTE